jgi:hypothetical protein
MKTNLVKRNEFLFLFLLHPDTTKEQKYHILFNLSKTQIYAIIELLYNLKKNSNISVPRGLAKTLKEHSFLIDKLFLPHQVGVNQRYIKKHYRTIYQILLRAKRVILGIIEQSSK